MRAGIYVDRASGGFSREAETSTHLIPSRPDINPEGTMKLLGVRIVYWWLVGFALLVCASVYMTCEEYAPRGSSYSGDPGVNYSTGDDVP